MARRAYFSFNTTLVQLKARARSGLAPSQSRFNTTLVQLKACTWSSGKRCQSFQYHTGPIKRRTRSKRSTPKLCRFQYHTGPIKRSTPTFHRLSANCFNTTLVQLKVTPSALAPPALASSFNTTLVQLKDCRNGEWNSLGISVSIPHWSN